ncbi:MAG: hypothetical protein LUG91_07630 [Ruminococcus sp.]|nr:hypothetical protein [Ruminococcus sp.]
MKKAIKKIAVTVFTTASLSALMVGMNANALTASDSYSIFTWNRSGTSVSSSLTNTSGSSRYAQVNAYGYNTAGYYVSNIAKEGTLAQSESVSTSGTISAATYTFGGTLYSGTTPTGTPLSSWIKSS